METFRLVHRVLASGRVEHEQYLVGYALVLLAQHAHDLFQFAHEIVPGVQAAGRVGDEHIDFLCPRRLPGVEDHRGAVGACRLGYDRHIVMFAPGLQLLDRGGAKGVARGQHH